MEGDLHFSAWEGSLEGTETREDRDLCALNELSPCASDSPRGTFRSPVQDQDMRGKQGGNGDGVC